MDNLLSFIGLMRRAGALAAGAEAAFDACRTGRARLVAVADDAAPNTKNAVRAVAEECGTPRIVLPRDKAETGQAIGMAECAVFAVCGTGFAIALCEKTGQTEPLEVLARRLRREQKKRRPGGKADTSAKRGTKR